MIRENIAAVEEAIRETAAAVNRDPKEVTLIAVSKTKPVSMIEEAYQTGCRDFGENKVQELCEKYDQLPHDIRWHLIGHLQRNKVKDVVGKAYLIHSVDSLRLAEEIEKQAAAKNTEVSVLIEVNAAEEESKFGVRPEETEALIRQIAILPHVHVKGLMTVAPITENAADNGVYFSKLQQLCVDIGKKNIDNVTMNLLSMGMTGDYLEAVKKGATYVRVGTGIFGERNYAIN